MLAGAPGSAETALSVEGDAVVAIDEVCGEKLWEIPHPSADPERHPIVGPLVDGNVAYYAVEGDLFELDTLVGRVTRRSQFPAAIEKLDLRDGTLWVTVEVDDGTEPLKVDLPRVAAEHMRGFWDSGVFTIARPGRDYSGLLNDGKVPDGPERAEFRKLVAEREARDLTNPFYPFWSGRAASLEGDNQTAVHKYDKAMAVETPWSDDFLLCGLFEQIGEVTRAREVCARAVKKLEARGIHREQIGSLLTVVSSTRELRPAMEAAVAARDYDAADRIAEYVWAAFPGVESGFLGWTQLARWLADAGRPKLAAKWQERATAARSAPSTRSFWARGRTVDHILLFLIAALIALHVGGFALGLRAARDGAEDARLPRPRVVEVVLAALLALSLVPASYVAAREVAAVGFHAAAPTSLLSGGVGSPAVLTWLEGAPSAPPIDELRRYAEHEVAQLKAGQPIEKPAPSPETVRAAIEELAAVSARETFWTARPAGTEVTFPPVAPLSLPSLVTFYFFAILGFQLGRRRSRIARGVRWIVPGLAAPAALAPLVAGVFAAGFVGAFTPFGEMLQSLTTPAYATYMGLGDLPTLETPYLSDSIWPWAAMAAALAVHLVSAVRLRVARD